MPTGAEHLFHDDVEYYDDRASGLLASAQDGTPNAVAAFGRFEQAQTPEGARAVVAAQHGFADWDALIAAVGEMGHAPGPFARAYRLVESQDVDGLREILDSHPDLVDARGTNANDLLGMATSNRDERLVALLLERGSDPAHANAHGWTAVHQAAYVGLPSLVAMLLDAGCARDVSARGDGGTPLVVALFWGHRDTAEVLAAAGVAPRNLRTAAGLGDIGAIHALAAGGGRVRPEAGAHRAFYRPHSGFPQWQPSDDPREILDESLTWAARNDRVDAIDALIDRGAVVDADVYRGTALAWAAACGRTDALERLLKRGADPDKRTTFGGPDHGEGTTAMHLVAQRGDQAAIDVLLRAGADPTIKDGRYDSTPAGWADHGGHPAVRDALLARES